MAPLLFSIYTDSIITSLIFSKVQAYADNIQVYIHFKSDDATDTALKLNLHLEIVSQIDDVPLESKFSCKYKYILIFVEFSL